MRAFSKTTKRVLLSTLLWVLLGAAQAGVDVYGTVKNVWLRGDGDLYFQLLPNSNSPSISPYCSGGWHELNMLVPRSDPDYSHLYGIILYAHSKQKMVSIANISVHSGQVYCDITQTGYGIIIFQ